MDSLCYIKSRWWRISLFGLWLINIVIALLIITVIIPSRLAPYFLLLMFVIYQIILGVRGKVKSIEGYYSSIAELPSIEGKLTVCTLEVEQLLELDFSYINGIISIGDSVIIQTDLDGTDYNKIYLFGITMDDEDKLLDIREFDGNVYVFKKEEADA